MYIIVFREKSAVESILLKLSCSFAFGQLHITLNEPLINMHLPARSPLQLYSYCLPESHAGNLIPAGI